MSEAYIGEIRLAAFGTIPRGWLQCNGQLLQVKQYGALFALLGTRFGGDGTTTFALPDFRGRVPIHSGNGTGLAPRRTGGLPPRTMGEKGGNETVPLTIKSVSSTTGSITYIDGDMPPPSNMMPFLALNFIIAIAGEFPSKNLYDL